MYVEISSKKEKDNQTSKVEHHGVFGATAQIDKIAAYNNGIGILPFHTIFSMIFLLKNNLSVQICTKIKFNSLQKVCICKKYILCKEKPVEECLVWTLYRLIRD
jgi:hypothetical protein